MGGANSRSGLNKFIESLPQDEMVQLLNQPPVILSQPPALFKGVLSSYTKFMDGPINKALRTGVGAKLIVDYIRMIEEDILRTPPIQNYIAFRGLKTRIDPEVGDIITDKGFMSKSADPAVGFNLIGESEDSGTLLILHYPGITHQLFIQPYSRYPDENEVPTLPGESFRVRRVITGMDQPINLVYATFEFREEPVVQIDLRIDEGFRDIQPIIELLKYELTQNKFIGVKTVKGFDFIYIEGNPSVPVDEKGNLLSGVSWSIFEETPIELERRIIAAWYSEILEGLYILTVPEFQKRTFTIDHGRKGYEDYDEYDLDPNWTLKRKEERDIFALSHSIIIGNLVSIDDGLPTPNIERVF